VAEQGPAVANRTPIFAVLGANAVSQVGDMMAAVAMPWFILEDGRAEIQVTYRFGPPSVPRVSEEALSMVHRKNGRPSGTPATDALTLTVVTLR
jgi:hypothetical protein